MDYGFQQSVPSPNPKPDWLQNWNQLPRVAAIKFQGLYSTPKTAINRKTNNAGPSK